MARNKKRTKLQTSSSVKRRRTGDQSSSSSSSSMERPKVEPTAAAVETFLLKVPKIVEWLVDVVDRQAEEIIMKDQQIAHLLHVVEEQDQEQRPAHAISPPLFPLPLFPLPSSPPLSPPLSSPIKPADEDMPFIDLEFGAGLLDNLPFLPKREDAETSTEEYAVQYAAKRAKVVGALEKIQHNMPVVIGLVYSLTDSKFATQEAIASKDAEIASLEEEKAVSEAARDSLRVQLDKAQLEVDQLKEQLKASSIKLAEQTAKQSMVLEGYMQKRDLQMRQLVSLVQSQPQTKEAAESVATAVFTARIAAEMDRVKAGYTTEIANLRAELARAKVVNGNGTMPAYAVHQQRSVIKVTGEAALETTSNSSNPSLSSSSSPSL